jgi:hypothetical protein
MESRHALVYLCPDSCKPKVRMTFAAAKPSLVSHIKSLGIAFSSVEVSSKSDLLPRIEEAFADPVVETRPAAPASRPMVKGPRMFMPE